MLMKRVFACLIAFTVIFTITSCNSTPPENEIPPVTGGFEFSVLKAGQADAIILRTQNHNVIIDCGEKDDGKKIVSYLKDNNIEKLDHLFITHFDKDHVGGFPEVIVNVSADSVVVADYRGSDQEYEAYLKAVAENETPITIQKERASFVLDDVLFEVAPPEKASYSEGDNDFSLVISVTHGENTFLFAGDAQTERLAEVLSVFGRQHNFLKVPHHGRYNKGTKRFISVVRPAYSVITDSEKNPADDKTINILNSYGSEIYSTKAGNVRVVSDGKTISITQ